MKNVNFLKSVLFAFLAITTFSCSDDDDAGTPQSNTIAAIASRTDNLSILVQALDRAGLVTAVDGTTALTVFAPTNEAFENFLDENGFANLEAVPVDVLRQVLLNHVVAGGVQSSQLTTGYIETLAIYNGEADRNLNMFVNTTSGVTLNGVSDVVTPNIIASNGVVHVVDTVIGLPTVVTFATADPNFSSLVAALTSEGQPDFVSILSGEGPFTVFAPTNDAFDDLTAELAAIPLVPSTAQLTAVLQYHVVSGNILSSSLQNNQSVTTLQGGTFTVGLTNGAKITDANARVSNIIAVDVQANNGVIHVLDKVLLPEL